MPKKNPNIEIMNLKEERDLFLSLLKRFADEYNMMGCYPAITKKEIADTLNPIARDIFATLDKVEKNG
jgi:hypothetical protein